MNSVAQIHQQTEAIREHANNVVGGLQHAINETNAILQTIEGIGSGVEEMRSAAAGTVAVAERLLECDQQLSAVLTHVDAYRARL